MPPQICCGAARMNQSESGLILVLLILTAVFLTWLAGRRERKRAERRFEKQLAGQFGKAPEPPSPDRLEAYRHGIPGYDRHHRHADGVDDITCNDLELEQVFWRINYCQSAAGEEYLYWLLRSPALSAKEEHLISQDGAERLRLQKLLHRLRRDDRNSFCDHLDLLDGLGRRSNRLHFLCLALLGASLALLVAAPRPGILALFAVMAFNIVSYYRQKNENDLYLHTFRFLLRLLSCA